MGFTRACSVWSPLGPPGSAQLRPILQVAAQCWPLRSRDAWSPGAGAARRQSRDAPFGLLKHLPYVRLVLAQPKEYENLNALNDMSDAISGYFDDLLDRITMPERERVAALARAVHISEIIARNIAIQNVVITGSMSRGTAIRNFSDVDILVSLEKWTLEDQPKPAAMVSRLAQALSREFPGAHILGNVVRVDFPSGPDVDVLTGLCDSLNDLGNQVYMIPTEDLRRWQPFEPANIDQALYVRSGELGPKFKALIRLIKWWSRENGRPLASYEIETIASSSFGQSMPELPESVAMFFDSAVRSVHDRQDLNMTKLKSAGSLARKSLEESANGNFMESISGWRCLLGA